jgi:ferredoxin
MPRVHFRKENVTVHGPERSNLRALCLEYGIDPYPALGGAMSCRGKGMCGTCAVGVDGEDGCMSDPGPREAKFLKRQPDHLKGWLRLSCCAEVMGDVTIDSDPDRKESWKKHGFYAGRPMRSWEKRS